MGLPQTLSYRSLNKPETFFVSGGEPGALVLIAEDHEDTRFLLRTLLEMRGFKIVEARDGEEAIEVAERERPNLVLMDALMPRLDGFSATRRLRENLTLGRVPIVFISARAEPKARALAFAAGCDDYLVKPFSTKLLDQVLAKHFACAGPATAEMQRSFL